MKQILIVGNWKSNKTSLEANAWLQGFKNYDLRFTNKEIVICPPFTLLPILKSYLLNLPAGEAGHKSAVRLGAQDISPFDEGAYTGEINGKQIKEFADYVIIGHSERRKHFGETNEIVDQKIAQAIKNQLTPIVCISEIEQIKDLRLKINDSQIIIAYEPLFAIGSGTADTPENAEAIAKEIKTILDAPVIYGGSVTSKNVKSFTQTPHIDGVLVGGASLDAHEFTNIVEEA